MITLQNEFNRVVRERDALRRAIFKVLADEESGTGWGPDVTTVQYLQDALDKTGGSVRV